MAVTSKGKFLRKALTSYVKDNPGWLGGLLEIADSVASQGYSNSLGVEHERWHSQLEAIRQIRSASYRREH